MASSQRTLAPAPPDWPGKELDKNERRSSKKFGDKISVACIPCRQRKSKCDGTLPCEACVTKQLSCAYEQEPGISRIDRLKAQVTRSSQDVNAFMSILNYLQGPSDEINDIVGQLNSGTPVEDVARSVINRSTSTLMDTQSSIPSSEANFKSESSSTINERLQDTETESYALLQATLSELVRFTKTNVEVIDSALAAYRDTLGPLFHIYGAEEVENLRLSLSARNSEEWSKPLLCKILGIAALGSISSKSNVSHAAKLCFYNLSKLLVDETVGSRNLEAVKILALPVLYNLIDESLVALVYVEAGLAFSEMIGLAQSPKPDNISDFEWRDKRKVWRTLVLYKTWIVASQGSLSDTGWNIARSTMLKLTDDIELGGQPTDAVQLQIIKIAVIKHRMLHVMYKNNHITAFELQNTATSLEEWYDELPECMRTQSPEFTSLDSQLRSQILYVHFLYLGVIILVYRQVLSNYRHRMERGIRVSDEFSAAAISAAQKGLMASQQTSRTLVLLLSAEFNFCPCWLCVFQTYTCTAVMLHDVGQRIIHGENLDNCFETLEHVNNCLTCLARSESTDAIVHRLLTTLRSYYELIMKEIPISTPRDILETNQDDMYTLKYLHMLAKVPTGQSPLHRAVRGLLDMLSHPFNGGSSSNPLNRLEEEQARGHSHAYFDDNRITAHLLGNLDHGYISGRTLPPGWLHIASTSLTE